MLYPLEGAEAPTLLDKLVPRTSRDHVRKARAWWLRNAATLERFRAAPRDRKAPRRAAKAPPPPRKRPAAGRAAPTPKRRPPGPRDVLGVAADATLADVRRAWRAAAKRWHPDRFATKDPVVLAEAHSRLLEARAAYEALVAELSR
jgi:DnaJ-domain-containing protein 1